jgi:hypothetical protein
MQGTLMKHEVVAILCVERVFPRQPLLKVVHISCFQNVVFIHVGAVQVLDLSLTGFDILRLAEIF